MPRGNGTGPMGMGPMTGRRAGYCSGFAVPGYANPDRFAGGLGYGRGFRRRFCATGVPRCGYSAEAGGAGEAPFDEKAFLTRQAGVLEARLQQVKERLSSLNEEAR